MVYPNILPPSVVANASGTGTGAQNTARAPTPHPPRVEYLATLAKHQAPVNVVRFSPDGWWRRVLLFTQHIDSL